MSVQIEKNTTKTPPPLGEKERKGPRQTPDDDDDDVESEGDDDDEPKNPNLARFANRFETAQTRTLPRTLPEHLSKLTFPWIQILRFGARFPSWQPFLPVNNVRDGFAQVVGTHRFVHEMFVFRLSFFLSLYFR